MYKLEFFVNASGWVVDPVYGKRGYENCHYFATKEEAMLWLTNGNGKGCDLISLTKVTDEEFAEDIIL